MPAKTVMIQGTGSHVGKSVVAAAICRMLQEDGWRVAPFKAQNMSLNSFVTLEGAEIARSQAMQAQACKIEPTADMNPILMKPNHDTNAQIILHGRPVRNMSVTEYADFKKEVFPLVMDSLNRLKNEYDIVVIEGAGSPAEINLRDQDIVNMKIAMAGNAPVILVGDIDKGGVFASFVGTIELLEPEERDHIVAFLINKFRGDISLLSSGIDSITRRTGKPTIGVIPFCRSLNLPEEDSLPLRNHRTTSEGEVRIRVILIPHLSNFTDFDALQGEPDVDLRFVKTPADCADADLIILPGSKATIADLSYLTELGFREFLQFKSGKSTIMGICAGFQILGQTIADPLKVESQISEAKGFGLIPSKTFFQKQKETNQIFGHLFEQSLPVAGYEIHHGQIKLEAPYTPFFVIQHGTVRRTEGYADAVRHVYGTSIHGIFDAAEFRRWFLNRIRESKGLPSLSVRSIDPDLPFREWAAVVRENIDTELLYQIIENQI